jgi:hypothetical protein
MFRDDYRSGGAPLDTAEECAAADEAYAQDCAAQAGGTCFDVAQAIADTLDRRRDEWRADDIPALNRLHTLLSQALLMARQINPDACAPETLLAACERAAGIATTHNEGE